MPGSKAIKTLLKKRSIKQEDFAEMLGIKYITLRHMLNRNQWNTNTIKRICELLKCRFVIIDNGEILDIE